MLIPSHSMAKNTTTILLLGDSITAGYNLPESQTLAVILQQKLQKNGYDVKIINGGVSGDTTSGGRSRLNWMLKTHNPTIVVLGLGGNDMLRGIPPAVTRENVFAIVERLQQQHIITVLTAVQASSNWGEAFVSSFNNIYTDLAVKYNLKLHPFMLEKVFGTTELMLSDGIHPNAKGIHVIADMLNDALTPSLDMLNMHSFTLK